METPSIRLSRQYAAPPETVFAAWTGPAVVGRWFAPTYEYDAHVDQFDASPGGRYRIEMRHQLGTVNTVGGVFETVDAPNRLVFSWAWEGEGMGDMGTSRVTVDFAPADGGTTVTLTHDEFAMQAHADPHLEGWEGCLWHLAGALDLDPARHVATTLALNARLFRNVLDGISPDDLAVRTGEANHATWIAAHAAQCRVDLAGILGVEVESSLTPYQNAVPDDAPLPDAETITDVYRRASAGINQGLWHVTPEALAGPAPFPAPINDPTLGGVIDFLIDHDTYHIGQLSLLRRVLGYPAMSYDAVEAAVLA